MAYEFYTETPYPLCLLPSMYLSDWESQVGFGLWNWTGSGVWLCYLLTE
jgi:hypothetical protein